MRLYSGSNRFNSDSGDRMTGAAPHASRTPPAIPSERTFHSHPDISGVFLAAAGNPCEQLCCPGAPGSAWRSGGIPGQYVGRAFRVSGSCVEGKAIAQEEGDSSAGQGCEERIGKFQAIHPFRAGAQINPGRPGRILRQGADRCAESGGNNPSPGCAGVL
ncbi:MAG: hypothetical protein H6Q06_2629 [Acidobacteria bacterium]|nr:hypothetical protein [Acidobacteriota bacterium]